MKYRVGVDIGGTKANIGILDENGEILAKCKMPVTSQVGCKDILRKVNIALCDLLSSIGLLATDVLSCGMGVPGTVSEDGRMAIKVPNLHWENESCAAIFETFTGISTSLVQDSRAAALGEYLMGAAKGRKLVVCVTLGTGIGMGIVLDGRIFSGALGGAGEVGHIIAKPEGRLCGCGKSGCMETYSSGRGIARTAKENEFWKGQSPSSEDVFRAAVEGNHAALWIISEAAEILGRALVATVNILSPDAIIFSGGMCRQTELYVQPITNYIRDHAYSLSTSQRLLISTALLGEDSPMVGAALLNMQVQ